MEKEQNYFFVCTIETDFLICAGITSIIKGLNGNSKCHVLIPKHERVRSKLENYYSCFDKVIILPFCSTKRNILNGFKECKYFLSKFRQIKIPHSSVFVMFEIYELPDLLIYNEIRKQYYKKKVKRVLISAFQNEEAYPENVQIDYKASLLQGFYSLLFSKKLFQVYKTKGTNASGIKHYSANWHFQLCLEGAKKSRANSINDIMELPYPAKFINVKNKLDLLEESSILILVTTMISQNGSIYQNIYWERINQLIAFLRNKYNSIIYIKNHPGSPYDHSTELLDDKKVRNIDKEICAEEIYLTNRNKIRAVFGDGSTALITASWLGIKAFNVIRYLNLGLGEPILKRLDDFMSIGSDIENIQSLDEINIPEIKMDKDKNRLLEEMQRKVWEKVIENIERAG